MLPIWPGHPPGVQQPPTTLIITERSQPPDLRDRFATDIDQPTLRVFPAVKPTGVAILVIPGGGYQRVVMDKEGYEVAEWLAQRGITAFVLLYRLPGENWSAGADTPLQDTQRSMRWIRHHAADFSIDPTRLGVVGFSAGGHAAATLITSYDRTVYANIDEIDRQSARPDFAALIYPVISMRDDLTHEISFPRLFSADTTRRRNPRICAKRSLRHSESSNFSNGSFSRRDNLFYYRRKKIRARLFCLSPSPKNNFRSRAEKTRYGTSFRDCLRVEQKSNYATKLKLTTKITILKFSFFIFPV
jgi:acetyl esterase/lipase